MRCSPPAATQREKWRHGISPNGKDLETEKADSEIARATPFDVVASPTESASESSIAKYDRQSQAKCSARSSTDGATNRSPLANAPETAQAGSGGSPRMGFALYRKKLRQYRFVMSAVLPCFLRGNYNARCTRIACFFFSAICMEIFVTRLILRRRIFSASG